MKFSTLALLALLIGAAIAAPSKEENPSSEETGKTSGESDIDEDWTWHKSKIVLVVESKIYKAIF